MKKSLLLGAAAFAAMAYVGSADAGEIKTGGYYMFRVLSADATLGDDGQADDSRYWAHRLQLKTDFIATPKTHAHAVIRVLGTDVVSANNQRAGDADNTSGVQKDGTPKDTTWQVNQAWLETEAWTVGLKVGEMPISMNDKILVNNTKDENSYGAIMLSKTFGEITAVLADVRTAEGSITATDWSSKTSATTGLGSDEDDQDLYVLSLLGSAEAINYQLTAAFLNQRDTNLDADNGWLAGTVGGDMEGINWSGSVIYENGQDTTANDQGANDGLLAALRVKGKAGFGGWNGYAFWAGKNFNNITPTNPEWSQTWDGGGPGAVDLMGRDGFAKNYKMADDGTVSGNGIKGSNISDTENMMGLGFGLTFETSGWTINPMLDFAAIDEEDIQGNDGVSDFAADSAWGGSMVLSTNIDKDTKLSLIGSWVDPDATDAGTAENMYNASVDVKMVF